MDETATRLNGFDGNGIFCGSAVLEADGNWHIRSSWLHIERSCEEGVRLALWVYCGAVVIRPEEIKK